MENDGRSAAARLGARAGRRRSARPLARHPAGGGLAVAVAIIALAAGPPGPGSAQRGVPRFETGANPLTLEGEARPGRYVADQGRRAAVFGDESGAFEVWVWPTKLVRDLGLAFRIPEYDEPIPAAAVARHVQVRPEGIAIVYSHATFTVRQHIFVPLEEPGALMLLEVETVRPLEVQVRMQADFGLAWPGSFGGSTITWQADERRFLLSQGGVRLYNAFTGSPFAVGGTSHAAHDAPLLPSQFTLRFDAARAAAEFIPVIVAGGAMSRDSAAAVYGRLARDAARTWREKVRHYEIIRSDLLSIRSPEPALDLALEWAKVNLDQQLVCNPDLGCGLVAGFGRAGPNNYRPGFGWFFGGDASINSLAMVGLGQFGLVRQGLEFLAKYQRADGKITHEISQSAARLPWFTDYPYTFFHGDTTPFWILACHRYWLASGDDAFLRDMWPRIVRAFRWSASTDGDGDGLMENPLAGAGAIEVGGLGADLHTDIYLAGVWIAALDGVRAMAAATGDRRVERDAAALHEQGRARLDDGFWLEGPGIWAFALLRPGPEGGQAARTNDALTVWPATALAFGLLDAARADRMLRAIGSHAITADWGARMLSSEHPLYDPLHYNNGTVWGFVTGFAALAHYRYHRAWAGHDLIRDVARTTFDFARGRNPELLSGSFYRTLDTSVPQQFFATSMLVSPLIRGLLGLTADAPAGAVHVAPHLPADWDSVSVSRFRAGSAVLDVAIRRGRGRYEVRLGRTDAGPDPLRVTVAPALPPGSRVTGLTVNGEAADWLAEPTPHDVHAATTVMLRDSLRLELRYEGGVEIAAPAETPPVGASSVGVRVLDFRVTGDDGVIEVEGQAGRSYELVIRAGRAPTEWAGATATRSAGELHSIRVSLPAGAGLTRQEIRFRVVDR